MATYYGWYDLLIYYLVEKGYYDNYIFSFIGYSLTVLDL